MRISEVREVVYVSERKLEWEFIDANRSGRRKPGVEASVGLAGNGLKVSVPSAAPTGTLGPAEVAGRLETVIRYLNKRNPHQFSASGLPDKLQTNQWIRFDLEMRYGTAREDSAVPGSPDDVVLFAGSVPVEHDVNTRSFDLLLCGSVQHLRSRIVSHGRMGSNTDWLYELTKELNRRENANMHVIPEFLTSIISRQRSQRNPDQVARDVFGSLSRSEDPRPDYGRLRGHARVLMDISDPNSITRLVVATPLYIERVDPRRDRRWWTRPIRSR